MSGAIACPSCRSMIPVSLEDAGKRGKCPSCGGPIQAPPREALAATRTAVPASESAPTRLTAAPEKLSRSSARLAAVPDASSELVSEVERARADPSRTLGPFLLLSELGKGGMGVVHRAWDDRLRRVVAVKTLLGEDAGPDAVRRFKREAEAVARLRHPAIVAVHEAGEIRRNAAPPVHYIAMDFVRGETLAKLVSGKQKLSLTKALEVVRDVARAVHYAHEQGVVHRDLKPQNVMIDASGRPWVLDFGLARVAGLADRSRLTRTGVALGTPAYMPPEQASGEGTDERSDVYSLGATLYHVLTGKPPFEGSTEYNVIVAVIAKDPVPPGSLNPRAAGDLETIAMRCLEKEPSRRYESAKAFADDLERHLAGEPIAARPIGRIGRARRWARRNRLLASALSLLVLVLAGGGAFLVRERRERALVEQERAREEAEVAWNAFEKGRKTARGDELVALALDAFQAAWRRSGLSPDDASARRGAFDAACTLGDVALESAQWGVARTAFQRALQLHVDDPGARERLARLEAERTRVATEHRAEIARVVSFARAGRIAGFPGGRDGALIALVRYPEPQTVAVLGAEVSSTSRRLRESLRDLYLRASVPGIEAAARTWFELAPGESLRDESRAVLRAAEARIETDDLGSRGKTFSAARRFRDIARERQNLAGSRRRPSAASRGRATPARSPSSRRRSRRSASARTASSGSWWSLPGRKSPMPTRQVSRPPPRS
ncbi:serine/threonine protein kinase [bacterium]|nr:serine/threonine protein kinase [bacterium]